MTSHFTLKKKINDRGYYAGVIVDVDVIRDGQDLTIEFNCDPFEFRDSLIFGVNLFYEHYRRSTTPAKIKVSIMRFNWMNVDTTNSAAAYVVAKALCECFKLDISELRLDEKTGKFIFPTPLQ